MPGLIERIIRAVIKWYVDRLVCQHFCKFKQAGSDLTYTHVHIMSANPNGVSGLGHDDHTGVEDDGHVTISKGGEVTIQAEDEVTMGLREFGYLGTAHFHEAPDGGECPRGFTSIRCSCPNEEGDPTNVTVCYTMDYDEFRRWYEAQRWDNQAGEYAYPYIFANAVTDERPGQINCGREVILRQLTLRVVNDCDGFGGPGDGENPLIQEARTKLQEAADKISCEPGCNKTVEEIFRGWRCNPNEFENGGLAEGLVLWRIRCQRDQ